MPDVTSDAHARVGALASVVSTLTRRPLRSDLDPPRVGVALTCVLTLMVALTVVYAHVAASGDWWGVAVPLFVALIAIGELNVLEMPEGHEVSLGDLVSAIAIIVLPVAPLGAVLALSPWAVMLGVPRSWARGVVWGGSALFVQLGGVLAMLASRSVLDPPGAWAIAVDTVFVLVGMRIGDVFGNVPIIVWSMRQRGHHVTWPGITAELLLNRQILVVMAGLELPMVMLAAAAWQVGEPLVVLVGAPYVLAWYATRTSLRLHAAQLEARRDPLTGIGNRRALYEVADDLMASSASVAVLVCDLDHFKRVNDTHGHAVGDESLRRVAAVLGEQAPEGAAIARIGGEEFAIVLEAHGLAPVLALAHAVREHAGRELASVGSSLSIGVVVSSAGEPLDTNLARADEALYRAKRLGRNRVEVWMGMVASGEDVAAA